MHGAAYELQAAGCRLAGGHSCLGGDLALGFSITGHAPEGRLFLKGGLRGGHALVLTKALGTGLVLRAGMLRTVAARDLIDAWASMAQSNGGALPHLRAAGVAACTDVTGFGLLGHALEMAEASKVCTRRRPCSMAAARCDAAVGTRLFARVCSVARWGEVIAPAGDAGDCPARGAAASGRARSSRGGHQIQRVCEQRAAHEPRRMRGRRCGAAAAARAVGPTDLWCAPATAAQGFPTHPTAALWRGKRVRSPVARHELCNLCSVVGTWYV